MNNLKNYCSCGVFVVLMLAGFAAAKIPLASYPDTFLWKIEKAGQPTSYLLGTVHVGKITATLPQHVVGAFEQTQALMTESALGDDAELALMFNALFDPAINLAEHYQQPQLAQINAALADIIPATMISQLRPWALMMLLMYSVPEGYSVTMGIDLLLTQRAVTQGKPVLGLEKMETQLGFFTALTRDQIEQFITLTLVNDANLKRESQAIIELYEQNQAQKLFDKVHSDDSIKFFPKKDQAFWQHWFFDQLLYERNRNWLPDLDRQLLKAPTFVAVGSAHLFGNEGLINLLTLKGYTLTACFP